MNTIAAPRYENPLDYIRQTGTKSSTLFFNRQALTARIRTFVDGFDGQLTFAVKSHPERMVLEQMLEDGVQGFDVASPYEIKLLHNIAPHAALHYNNPVRTREEIETALAMGVRSYSVDCMQELEKLLEMTTMPVEIAVRFKLDLGGAAYNFGSKFGAERFETVEMLKRIAQTPHDISMTFHVGTHCKMPELYTRYIVEAHFCAEQAGVEIKRLNVGGGFPSARGGDEPDYQAYFDAIKVGMEEFDKAPALVCEPGRALVGDAFDYMVHVKACMHGRWVFLTDGIYGGLSELNIVEHPGYAFYSPDAEMRIGRQHQVTCYGPTCDSLDTLHAPVALPEDVQEGDYMFFRGLGAYIIGPNTSFNGYGDFDIIEVASLDYD